MAQIQYSPQEFPKEVIKEALNPVRHPVDVAVYGVGNYFNLATIIRTCHSFLVRRIYVIDSEGFYEKGTMGNHKFEDIREMPLNVFMEIVRQEKRNLVVFERRPGIKTKDIRNFQYPENPILVFGSERSGVPDVIIDQVGGWDNIVSVPVYGINNDLNIGIAAGIAIYDWVSKYHKND